MSAGGLGGVGPVSVFGDMIEAFEREEAVELAAFRAAARSLARSPGRKSGTRGEPSILGQLLDVGVGVETGEPVAWGIENEEVEEEENGEVDAALDRFCEAEEGSMHDLVRDALEGVLDRVRKARVVFGWRQYAIERRQERVFERELLRRCLLRWRDAVVRSRMEGFIEGGAEREVVRLEMMRGREEMVDVGSDGVEMESGGSLLVREGVVLRGRDVVEEVVGDGVLDREWERYVAGLRLGADHFRMRRLREGIRVWRRWRVQEQVRRRKWLRGILEGWRRVARAEVVGRGVRVRRTSKMAELAWRRWSEAGRQRLERRRRVERLLRRRAGGWLSKWRRAARARQNGRVLEQRVRRRRLEEVMDGMLAVTVRRRRMRERLWSGADKVERVVERRLVRQVMEQWVMETRVDMAKEMAARRWYAKKLAVKVFRGWRTRLMGKWVRNRSKRICAAKAVMDWWRVWRATKMGRLQRQKRAMAGWKRWSAERSKRREWAGRMVEGRERRRLVRVAIMAWMQHAAAVWREQREHKMAERRRELARRDVAFLRWRAWSQRERRVRMAAAIVVQRRQIGCLGRVMEEWRRRRVEKERGRMEGFGRLRRVGNEVRRNKMWKRWVERSRMRKRLRVIATQVAAKSLQRRGRRAVGAWRRLFRFREVQRGILRRRAVRVWREWSLMKRVERGKRRRARDFAVGKILSKGLVAWQRVAERGAFRERELVRLQFCRWGMRRGMRRWREMARRQVAERRVTAVARARASARLGRAALERWKAETVRSKRRRRFLGVVWRWWRDRTQRKRHNILRNRLYQWKDRSEEIVVLRSGMWRWFQRTRRAAVRRFWRERVGQAAELLRRAHLFRRWHRRCKAAKWRRVRSKLQMWRTSMERQRRWRETRVAAERLGVARTMRWRFQQWRFVVEQERRLRFVGRVIEALRGKRLRVEVFGQWRRTFRNVVAARSIVQRGEQRRMAKVWMEWRRRTTAVRQWRVRVERARRRCALLGGVQRWRRFAVERVRERRLTRRAERWDTWGKMRRGVVLWRERVVEERRFRVRFLMARRSVLRRRITMALYRWIRHASVAKVAKTHRSMAKRFRLQSVVSRWRRRAEWEVQRKRHRADTAARGVILCRRREKRVLADVTHRWAVAALRRLAVRRGTERIQRRARRRRMRTVLKGWQQETQRMKRAEMIVGANRRSRVLRRVVVSWIRKYASRQQTRRAAKVLRALVVRRTTHQAMATWRFTLAAVRASKALHRRALLRRVWRIWHYDVRSTHVRQLALRRAVHTWSLRTQLVRAARRARKAIAVRNTQTIVQRCSKVLQLDAIRRWRTLLHVSKAGAPKLARRILRRWQALARIRRLVRRSTAAADAFYAQNLTAKSFRHWRIHRRLQLQDDHARLVAWNMRRAATAIAAWQRLFRRRRIWRHRARQAANPTTYRPGPSLQALVLTATSPLPNAQQDLGSPQQAPNRRPRWRRHPDRIPKRLRPPTLSPASSTSTSSPTTSAAAPPPPSSPSQPPNPTKKKPLATKQTNQRQRDPKLVQQARDLLHTPSSSSASLHENEETTISPITPSSPTKTAPTLIEQARAIVYASDDS